MSSDPTLCAGGCGFFGNASMSGFCSVCFKKQQGQQQGSVATAPAPTSAPTTAATTPAPKASTPSGPVAVAYSAPATSASSSTPPLSVPQPDASSVSTTGDEPMPDSPAPSASEEGAAASEKKAKKTRRERCAVCRKNVGLLGFRCKCDQLFCGTHRYADEHKCTFDYKAQGQQLLSKQNEKVMAEKIQKI